MNAKMPPIQYVLNKNTFLPTLIFTNVNISLIPRAPVYWEKGVFVGQIKPGDKWFANRVRVAFHPDLKIINRFLLVWIGQCIGLSRPRCEDDGFTGIYKTQIFYTVRKFKPSYQRK
jgi:hypothetical protein